MSKVIGEVAKKKAVNWTPQMEALFANLFNVVCTYSQFQKKIDEWKASSDYEGDGDRECFVLNLILGRKKKKNNALFPSLHAQLLVHLIPKNLQQPISLPLLLNNHLPQSQHQFLGRRPQHHQLHQDQLFQLRSLDTLLVLP